MASPSLISGVVRDPAGRPVPQARIYFTGGPVPLPEIAALSDGDGAFSLTAPMPGVYAVEATADGLGRKTETVTVGSQGVRVEIRLDR